MPAIINSNYDCYQIIVFGYQIDYLHSPTIGVKKEGLGNTLVVIYQSIDELVKSYRNVVVLEIYKF